MIRKIFFISFFSLCFSTISSSACLDEVKMFYKSYMTNFLKGRLNNEHLLEKYLTAGLVAKIKRMTYATWCDPIIRAQDVNEDAISSLMVKARENDWYVVSYLWNKKDSTTKTEIPLKAKCIDGKCKIVYITPEVNGVLYGDAMLACCEDMSISKIDETSGKTFVESFYNAYLALYCAMSEDINAQLSSLRLSHLSPIALQQFKKAELENQEDGCYGYDLLINDFDFDSMWYKSLKVAQLSNDRFLISYQKGVTICKIRIQIECQQGKYLIHSISLSENV